MQYSLKIEFTILLLTFFWPQMLSLVGTVATSWGWPMVTVYLSEDNPLEDMPLSTSPEGKAATLPGWGTMPVVEILLGRMQRGM
jgi:hypothetical protein